VASSFNTVSITKTTEAISTTAQSWAHYKKREILKNDKNSAVIEEQSGNESDSSDASE
jgi:hypothetical protein